MNPEAPSRSAMLPRGRGALCSNIQSLCSEALRTCQTQSASLQ
jgi:hypothetical protein